MILSTTRDEIVYALEEHGYTQAAKKVRRGEVDDATLRDIADYRETDLFVANVIEYHDLLAEIFSRRLKA